MATPLKIILTVSGIFLTGAVTGSFVGFRLAERHAASQKMSPRGGPVELLGGRAAEKLNLSPEQKQRVRPIIRRTAEDLRSISHDAFSRSAELIAEMDAELAKILSTEQLEKLREIRAKESERRRQWMLERGRHSEGRPPSDLNFKRSRPPEHPNPKTEPHGPPEAGENK
jgi:uncharacterized membrane protein